MASSEAGQSSDADLEILDIPDDLGMGMNDLRQLKLDFKNQESVGIDSVDMDMTDMEDIEAEGIHGGNLGVKKVVVADIDEDIIDLTEEETVEMHVEQIGKGSTYAKARVSDSFCFIRYQIFRLRICASLYLTGSQSCASWPSVSPVLCS